MDAGQSLEGVCALWGALGLSPRRVAEQSGLQLWSANQLLGCCVISMQETGKEKPRSLCKLSFEREARVPRRHSSITQVLS